MFLDDLIETGIVQLDEFSEVVNISDDVAQVFLEQGELLLGWSLLIQAAFRGPRDDLLDLALADGDATLYLGLLDLGLGVHLFELGVEPRDEGLFIFFGPPAALRFLRGRGVRGASLIVILAGMKRRPGRLLQLDLQPIVVDIVPLVFADEAGAQLLAKLHDDEARAAIELALRSLASLVGQLAHEWDGSLHSQTKQTTHKSPINGRGVYVEMREREAGSRAGCMIIAGLSV